MTLFQKMIFHSSWQTISQLIDYSINRKLTWNYFISDAAANYQDLIFILLLVLCDSKLTFFRFWNVEWLFKGWT